MSPQSLRHLVIILGDQLDADALALTDFDPTRDALWMAEVAEESTHIPSSKQRTALFLSAMRHFAKAQRALGRLLHYTLLDDTANTGTLAGELTRTLAHTRPEKLVMNAPGDWRVLKAIQAVAREHNIPLDLKDDTHFITTVREFAAHAKGRKQLRLEYFYREVRRKTGLLMESNDPTKPIGGQWNFDADNRGAFPAEGPTNVPPPVRFAPDAITRDVMALVQTRFASNPGTLDSFAWPVTRAQALDVLAAFITHRLPLFGRYQDAMWQGEVWLYHSHISCALNLKLLHPLEVARAAEQAYQRGDAPLEAVEGFIRQVIGWREYVRGIYWTQMPEYIDRNALQAEHPLPAVYWTGESEMACMRDAVQQTLAHGYAHHIQRLMVTGLYALLFGARPQEVHAWYLGVYVDAVEWVELPNTLGMSQFADGGVMASKPYAATGKYIQRMSNYCKGCRFKPDERIGPNACPMTTLYWDFLIRHQPLLAQNPRMALQVRNVDRISDDEKQAIQAQATAHRAQAG